jgi:ECF sigma factor
MHDVTQILSRIDSGDVTAAEQLLPLVYDELRKLAAHQLRREKPGQTLQATADLSPLPVRRGGASALQRTIRVGVKRFELPNSWSRIDSDRSRNSAFSPVRKCI